MPQLHCIRAARTTAASALILAIFTLKAEATFSIVAVDTANQIVGSAGASCIAGAKIIEDAVEGLGSINTQALWNAVNQAHADSLMRAGLTPDSIISWLVAHDAKNDGSDSRDRQYGVVTLAGPGASAGHTGAFNNYWAGHRTGPGYSVQGNILLDSTIILGMQAAFLATPGPLENRLMAALQAAKVPGADTRCFPQNKSSISAFIKVIHPGDGLVPYLDLQVSNTSGSTDPIDLLQGQFDAWRAEQVADPSLSTLEVTPAGLPDQGRDTAWLTLTVRNSLGEPPTFGSTLSFGHTGGGSLQPAADLGSGVYKAAVVAGLAVEPDTFRVQVTGGLQTITINSAPVLLYFLCGDTNADGVHTSADIIGLVNYVFKSGLPPLPVPQAGDVNRSGTLTSADIISLVNFVFKSGTPPCP
jgi:uncharacterized Ntn-hydrolase superfamily protein